MYDTIKNVWGWGERVGITNLFLGIAGHVTGMSGNMLRLVDGVVMDKMHSLDETVLNPFLPLFAFSIVAEKSEDLSRPLIITLPKPLGLINVQPKTPNAPHCHCAVNAERSVNPHARYIQGNDTRIYLQWQR